MGGLLPDPWQAVRQAMAGIHNATINRLITTGQKQDKQWKQLNSRKGSQATPEGGQKGLPTDRRPRCAAYCKRCLRKTSGCYSRTSKALSLGNGQGYCWSWPNSCCPRSNQLSIPPLAKQP